jgi:phosphate-selective porin OprO/OprP
MKEPFSLEELTSATARTFMEKALPTDAFTPGRNIGVSSYTAVFDQRITWGVGAFLNTGSFGNEGEAKDRINESNGFGISGRITGLPWYSENGDKLLHLGLSYRHDFRDSDNRDFPLKVRAKPESALTNDRLVDTGSIFANNSDLFDAELAVVHGPLSFQGEYFYGFIDANSQDDPSFWGFYLLSSYFLSGEHRNYNTKSGVFTRIKPKHPFHPTKGGWGAWELGIRFSYVDLNNKGVNGGKEHNLTAGLNWYLSTKTRFMFNYIRALVEDRQNRPSIEDGSADIFQARFQIAF